MIINCFLFQFRKINEIRREIKEKTRNFEILISFSSFFAFLFVPLHPKILIMGRNKKPLPLLEGVTIEAVAAEGKCLFHWQELVVFVPFCVPGDVCDVQIRRKKHSFAEGEVVRFIEYSNVRAIPFCEHFGVCGGCKWQNLPYEAQLKFKQQQVFDQLTRIGKVELPEFNPILGSVKTQEYRNKLDFGCANKRWLTSEQLKDESLVKNTPAIGFHITGAFDKILPIEKCWLMDDLHNKIRNEVRDYAIKNGLSFFDLRAQVGLLRDVIIRNSATGEWMVIFQFHYDETGGEKEALGLLQHIADTFPQITSLMYLDNQKCNDTIGDQEILVFKGKDHIFETMEDLKFKVGPKRRGPQLRRPDWQRDGVRLIHGDRNHC